MNNKFLLSFFLVVFSVAAVFGQTRKQYLKFAENSYAQKDFYGAMYYYQEVLDFDSTQIDPWYKLGVSARQFYAYSLSEKAFLKVCSLPEASQYPDANLMLADVQKGMGKYSEAIASYQRAIKDATITEALKTKASAGLESCEWAMEVVSNPDKNLAVENLGTNINSPASETAPQKIANELYYTSLQFEDLNDKHDPPRKFQKLMISEKGMSGEIWEDLDVTKGHVGNSVFNSDGSRIYYTLCDYVSDGEIRCDIFFRDKNADSGAWNEGEKLSEKVNASGYDNTQPEIAKVGDENWLLFSSDRLGGSGGMDVYYSVINADGSFSDAVNIGAINSPGDDITPFFHEATSTLYFSNNSRQGLGAHDVFKSVKTNDGWSAPEHGGYPLNSSLDDIFYKVSKGGASGYIASNRLGSTFIEKEKEACCHDIYSVQKQVVELAVTTFDKRNNDPLAGVTVTLSKLDGPEVESLTNNDGNDFGFEPERKYAYLLVAEKEGFSTEKDTIYLNRPPGDDVITISKEFYLEQNEINLTALTFNAYTKEGLVGTKVQLFEMVGGERRLVEEKTNPGGNDFTFKLLPGRTYVLRGSKNGYEHDLKTIEVPMLKDLKDNNIQVELNLAPLIFAEYLPISLYFDNDEPDKATRRTTTKKTYLETWDAYKAREQTFKDEFGKGMDGQIKQLSLDRLAGFFEKEVRGSGADLTKFTDLLYQFLKQGNNIELVLRGYTSPRAASDYNDRLSQRRISSVRNHFEEYGGGIYKQFLASGSLVISEKPYGETQSKTEVSDDIKDERNSIYGVPASLERRVEIIDVKQAENPVPGTR